MYNPLAQATARLTWRDLNGDDIAQGELGCVYLTTNCEINFGQLPDNFGSRVSAHLRPRHAAPMGVMSNIGIQHQLLPGFGVTAALVQSRFKELAIRDNILRTRADYTPITVYSPIDGEAITGLQPGRQQGDAGAGGGHDGHRRAQAAVHRRTS